MTGTDVEHPMKVGPGIGGIFPVVLAAFGLLAAVRHADATGAPSLERSNSGRARSAPTRWSRTLPAGSRAVRQLGGCIVGSPIELSATPVTRFAQAPLLGEHPVEVLARLTQPDQSWSTGVIARWVQSPIPPARTEEPL